ncbi:hypothetical protein FOZ63_033013, partial [Perkinsus olseni]
MLPFIRFPALVGFMTAMAALRPPVIGMDMVSEVRFGLKEYARTSSDHLLHFQRRPPDSVVDDPQKNKVNIRQGERQCEFEYGKGGTRLMFQLGSNHYLARIEHYGEGQHNLEIKTSPNDLGLVSYLSPSGLQLTMNPSDVVETKMKD